MDKKDAKESTTLIFKNIPKQIEDLTELLDKLKMPAREIKPFGRKRALITFQEKTEAEQALSTLKELEFNGNAVNVAIFCKDKPPTNKEEKTKPSVRKSNKSIQTVLEDKPGMAELNKQQQLNKYVQKLYAVESDLGFMQPPAPYLKYSYPPIDKDILDNICISLLSDKRFYTQVLHLMNRMNLEPPFNKRNYKFTPPGVPKEAQTQTDEVMLTVTPQEDVESELETSEDENKQKTKPPQQIKRKLLPDQEEQYKKRARQMLHNAQKLNKETQQKKPTKTNLSIKEIFETTGENLPSTSKIELQLKPSTKKETPTAKSSLILPNNLTTQKLTPEELDKLNIYKNYQKGVASNKLYVKNLHKDVLIDDLKLIYARYLKAEGLNLDIKLMQHGRMKGQAFVTFQGREMKIIEPLIAEALEETNGFVLRDKPMVVCYGKQT